MTTKTILIVDDSRVSRMMIKTFIEYKCPDWIIHEAANGEIALQLADQVKPDFCTMDINMPGMPGTDVAELLLKKYPSMRIVIFAGVIETQSETPAAKLGVVFIAKPVTENTVGQALSCFDPSV